MKPTLKIYRLIAIGFLLLPTTAKAEDYYVAISTGNTKDDLNSVSTESKIDGSDTGFSVAFGKEFNDGFSIEGFFADLGQIRLDAKAGETITIEGQPFVFLLDGTITGSTDTIGFAGKKAFNISESLDGFFKFGLHSWNIETNVVTSAGDTDKSKDDGTDIFWGLGANYDINEKTALFLGYDNYKVDEDAVTFLHIGVKFGF